MLCGAGANLERTLRQIAAARPDLHVALAYLNYCEPTLEEIASACLARGLTSLTVVPYFLFEGLFVRRMVGRQVGALMRQYPALEIRLAAPVGYDSRLSAAVMDAARAVHPPHYWRRLAHEAARQCRSNPRCPLWGTPDCPQSPPA